MASLSDVTVGSPTLASNINQIIDLLNGTVSGAITMLASSATTAANPINAVIPAVPAADSSVIESFVSGDAVARVATYVRSADGYGGIWAGKGPSVAAHWYAQSNGWKTDESVTIAAALTVSGSSSLAGVNTSGPVSVGGNLQATGTMTVNGSSSLDAGNITTDGAGRLTIAGTLVFGPAVSTSSAQMFYLPGISAVQVQTPQAGTGALGISFGTYTGSAGAIPFSLDGQFNGAKAWVDASGNFNGPAGGGIPTTRNGVALSVPIFTGTNPPVNPPTGSIWIKA